MPVVVLLGSFPTLNNRFDSKYCLLGWSKMSVVLIQFDKYNIEDSPRAMPDRSRAEGSALWSSPHSRNTDRRQTENGKVKKMYCAVYMCMVYMYIHSGIQFLVFHSWGFFQDVKLHVLKIVRVVNKCPLTIKINK